MDEEEVKDGQTRLEEQEEEEEEQVSPAACALSGSPCWSWSVSAGRPPLICPHTEPEEDHEDGVFCRTWRRSKSYPPPSWRRTWTHLHAGVPLLGERVVGEVLREAELRPQALHVLRQRRSAQQVDLTVREAWLDPLLQQFQDILGGGQRKKKEKKKDLYSPLRKNNQLWEEHKGRVLRVCRWGRPRRWEPEPTVTRRTGCRAASGSCGGRTGRTRPGRTAGGDCCCGRLVGGKRKKTQQN